MTITIGANQYDVALVALNFRGATAYRVTVTDAQGVVWSERVVTDEYVQTMGADVLAAMDAQDADNARSMAEA